jgi:hypothetical protein
MLASCDSMRKNRTSESGISTQDSAHNSSLVYSKISHRKEQMKSGKLILHASSVQISALELLLRDTDQRSVQTAICIHLAYRFGNWPPVCL